MSVTGGTAGLGSARVPRAGCGVPPQRTFSETLFPSKVFAAEEVRERLETFASTPEACAPQGHRLLPYENGHLQDLAWRCQRRRIS